MTENDLLATAQTIAESWGDLTAPPKPSECSDPAVFELHFVSGPPGLLHFTPEDGRGASVVQSVLLLMEGLADTGFACPWPLRTTDEGFIKVTTDGQIASVTQLLDAEPLAGTPDLEELGALIADLHLTADTVAPEDLELPKIDPAKLTDATRYQGLFAEDDAARSQIDTALDRAAGQLSNLPAATQGVIHGAVLPENLLHQGHQLYLINFEHCGLGDRTIDLATALLPFVDSDDWDKRVAELCQGYQNAGGAISEEAQSHLSLYAMLFAFERWAQAASGNGGELSALTDSAQRALQRFLS